MRLSLIGTFFLILFARLPQQEKQPVVYVKHLEPPMHYPPLARAARLHGTVIVKLTIGLDGTVLEAESSPEGSTVVGFPVLRDETEKLLKKWTFGCAFCSANASYVNTMRFRYVLEGDGISSDNTRVVMQLPDEVTITASPRECDHCPPTTKPSKSH